MYFSLSTLVSAAIVLLSTQGVGAVTGALGDAPVTTDNPVGVVYKATFNYPNGVNGYITFETPDNATGVAIDVSLDGFPSYGGPFLYHVHVDKVPDNGNCTATLGHLDPYERGDQPPADPANPQTAEVGDLSGKWGTIPSGPFSASYIDDYLSTNPDNVAYIGNRSVVVHLYNTTRIACANLELVSGGGGSNSSNSSGSAAQYSGAASSSTIGSQYGYFAAILTSVFIASAFMV